MRNSLFWNFRGLNWEGDIGGFLLSEALRIGFKNAKRIWVHTCSLDHPNAIENYKSRGMKIFKTEILKRQAI